MQRISVLENRNCAGQKDRVTTPQISLKILEELGEKVRLMKEQIEELKNEVKNSLWLWKQTRNISFVCIHDTYVPLSYACVLNYMAGRVLSDIIVSDPNIQHQTNFSSLYSHNPYVCQHHIQFFMQRSSDEQELTYFCNILSSASLLPPYIRELIDPRLLDNISEYLSNKQRTNQSELIDSLVLRAATMVVGDGLTKTSSSSFLCIESLEDDFDDDFDDDYEE